LIERESREADFKIEVNTTICEWGEAVDIYS